MADRGFLERLARELSDQGRLIEAGWVALRLTTIHPKASADQLEDMRGAYFAGAQHLFASIMSILDPGEEPTDADMDRMDKIHKELDAWTEQMKLRVSRMAGST